MFFAAKLLSVNAIGHSPTSQSIKMRPKDVAAPVVQMFHIWRPMVLQILPNNRAVAGGRSKPRPWAKMATKGPSWSSLSSTYTHDLSLPQVNMCSIDKSIHRDFPYHPPNTKRSRCVLLTRLAEGCRSTCCSNVSHLKTHGAADTTHMTSDEAKTLNPTCYALSSELVVEDSEEDEPFGASSLSSGKHLRHLTAFNGPPKSES